MFSIASRNKGQLNAFIAVLYSMMIGVAYYGRLYNATAAGSVSGPGTPAHCHFTG